MSALRGEGVCQLRTEERRFSSARMSALFVAKALRYFENYGVSARKWGRGLWQSGQEG